MANNITHYGNVSNARRRNIIILSCIMIVTSLAGVLLSIGFMIAGNAFRNGLPQFRVGWNESWTAKESFTEDFAGGDGSSNNPYLIKTPAQLARFAHQVNHRGGSWRNANYKLMADLNMSARRWDPIGRVDFEDHADDKTFYGTFDGNGKTITGISSQNIDHNYNRVAGFFGVVGDGAIIKNLTLTNSTIEVTNQGLAVPEGDMYGNVLANGGGVSVGIVVGVAEENANVTIQDVTVNSPRVTIPGGIGTDMKGYDIGGIIGNQLQRTQTSDDEWASSGTYGSLGKITIKNANVKNAAFVTQVQTSARRFGHKNEAPSDSEDGLNNSTIGGIIGAARKVAISGSSFIGSDIVVTNLTEPLSVGGIVGRVHAGHNQSGRTSETSLTDVKSTARIDVSNTSESYIGGIVGGVARRFTKLSIENATAESTLKLNVTSSRLGATNFVGGIVGDVANYENNTTLTNTNFDGTIDVNLTTNDTATKVAAGGLVGSIGKVDKDSNTTTIKNSTSNAIFTTTNANNANVGGIVGKSGSKNTTQLLDIQATGEFKVQTANKGGAVGSDSNEKITLSNVITAITGAGENLYANGSAGATDTVWQQELSTPTIKLISQKEQTITLSRGQGSATASVEVQSSSTMKTGPNRTFTTQWYFVQDDQELPILNQTNEKFDFSVSTPGTYQLFAKATNNLMGIKATAKSEVSTITVELEGAKPPVVTEQPQSQEVEFGQSNVVLTTNAQAPDELGQQGNLTFEWYQTVEGAQASEQATLLNQTEPKFDVDTSVAGNFFYFAKITNKLADGAKSSVFTDVAKVIVKSQDAPVISSQPALFTNAYVDTTFTLTVGATVGNGGLSYQWYSGKTEGDVNTLLPGETRSYFRGSSSVEGTMFYRVKVTNTITTTTGDVEEDHEKFIYSTVAKVTVEYPAVQKPIILESPKAVSATVGSTVTLEVEVDLIEGQTTSFQWFKSDNDVSNSGGEAIEGQTSPTLQITLDKVETFYVYCEVTNVLTANPNGDSLSEVSKHAKVQVLTEKQSRSAVMGGNLPWILIMVGSVGLMVVAFVMITRKSVEVY